MYYQNLIQERKISEVYQKDKIGTLDKNDEDDSFSEPDKEESRRRIGIDVVSDRESFGEQIKRH